MPANGAAAAVARSTPVGRGATDAPEIEDLIAKSDSHWVVRKSGDAGEFVEHLDPRSE